jgi:hypothetical protein
MRTCYVDSHEGGLWCYIVIHTGNLLRRLQLFYFHLWPIYWLSPRTSSGTPFLYNKILFYIIFLSFAANVTATYTYKESPYRSAHLSTLEILGYKATYTKLSTSGISFLWHVRNQALCLQCRICFVSLCLKWTTTLLRIRRYALNSGLSPW